MGSGKKRIMVDMDKANILIINNDRLVRKSLHEMLCRAGYNVSAAGSAEEALIYLTNNAYRVILADVDNGSGAETELLARIRANRCSPDWCW